MDDSSEDNLDAFAAFLADEYVPEESLPVQNQTSSEDNDVLSDSTASGLPTAGKDPHRPVTPKFKLDHDEEYQALFRHDLDTPADTNHFTSSQIDSTVWSAAEKAAFFQTLASHGRHDLAEISRSVGTKTEFEVRRYSMELNRAFINRQRYSENSKAVAHADIPAAIEIDPDLEQDLDQAADNLAKLQNDYDVNESMVANNDIGFWLINSEVADDLDATVTTEAEQSTDSEHDTELTGAPGPFQLFYHTTLLSLSRDLFMNMPQSSEHDHWAELATEEQPEPAMMVDVVKDLHNLVKGFVQRVLHSALFLANSRLRANAVNGKGPTTVLKDVDVIAALEILDLPTDSFEYWARFPVRSGLNVFMGVHDQGVSNTTFLSYEEVSNVLSVRGSRGRRRSISSMLSQSPQDLPEDGAISSPDTTSDIHVIEGQEERGVDSETSEFEEVYDSSPESSDVAEISSPVSVEKAKHVSRKQQLAMEEEIEDKYLERLDQNTSKKAQLDLRRLLGYDQAPSTSTAELLERRPRKRRKMEAELHDWTETILREPWKTMPSLE